MALILNIEGNYTFNFSSISPTWRYIKLDCLYRMISLTFSTFLLKHQLSSLFHLTLLLQVFSSVPLITLSHVYGYFIFAAIFENLLLCAYFIAFLTYLVSLVADTYYIWPLAVVSFALSFLNTLNYCNIVNLSLTSLYIIFFALSIFYLARLVILFYYKIRTSENRELYGRLSHIYLIQFSTTLILLITNSLTDFNLNPTLRFLSFITIALFHHILSPVSSVPDTELEVRLL